ncbi:ribosomal-protein-alanine acetyltransferase [Frondihabitans sucicola]|uniref:Ribosomal-protein-alanine acetyltransferase n=1 Tax=Frondihabitans sucicola TaxID=1268041 RepID=A0ABN6XW31_9MICO|nr:ribosomal protein S18-alanine N-acetyltransferase [Frondihabitans sucicola]BDZ49119.1 ribosomal-protein-alanine acetyltransferase [Frondihabitans sucicola]
MSAEPYEVRQATPADLDAIMAIETSVFVNDAWSPESMAHELANSSCFYQVVTDPAGEVVAYAGLLAAIGSPDSDIQTIAVAPGARRRGIARDLVRRMLEEASARGARETFLEVRVDNPGAQALYESFGFEGIAVRPRYYMPDGVDALVMRARLRPSGGTP